MLPRFPEGTAAEVVLDGDDEDCPTTFVLEPTTVAQLVRQSFHETIVLRTKAEAGENPNSADGAVQAREASIRAFSRSIKEIRNVPDAEGNPETLKGEDAITKFLFRELPASWYGRLIDKAQEMSVVKLKKIEGK